MIDRLAIANYRSILNLVIPLGTLNLVTGANGCGKSNLYRSLRLLAETAKGGVVEALAQEGGLHSTFWAGPESFSRAMLAGEIPVQGGPRRQPVRMHMGVGADDFSYAISLGLPKPSNSMFSLDPEIKRECIWAGPVYRPASNLVERKGPAVKVRQGRQWHVLNTPIQSFDSLLSEVANMDTTPECFQMRTRIAGWRFYDHFRTDKDAPARKNHIGTRTTVLSHDGHDLASAIQTIREIGDHQALDEAIERAFPGARIVIQGSEEGYLSLLFYQEGLLRPLTAAELSDGTLRYILWVAALLTPRPPSMMVLNEPESSLHPDLLPALATLIAQASERSQIWVVSHASRLIAALSQFEQCHAIELDKYLGQTQMKGQDLLNTPAWHWPD